MVKEERPASRSSFLPLQPREDSCSLFFPRPTGHWEHGRVVDVRSLADRLSG
jgi:hypothetical protein